jgi:hypothetical protein
LAVGCAHRGESRDCTGLTREQCVWQHAKRDDGPGPDRDPTDASDSAVDIGWESEGSWTRVEQMLEQAADWLSDGLGGQVLSREATQWCAQEPTPRDDGRGESWVCHVEDPPRIGDREFTLEASTSGVLAVAARDLDGKQSRQVVDLALRRWRDWCEGARFSRVERFQDEEFHRCALPGGPLLLVGRFPQDLEADLWQVSLTVMGAG